MNLLQLIKIMREDAAELLVYVHISQITDSAINNVFPNTREDYQTPFFVDNNYAKFIATYSYTPISTLFIKIQFIVLLWPSLRYNFSFIRSTKTKRPNGASITATLCVHSLTYLLYLFITFLKTNTYFN
jgi:hypothetical protein